MVQRKFNNINSVEGESNLAQAGDNQALLDQIARFRQTHPVPGLALNQLESYWFYGRTTYAFSKTSTPGVIASQSIIIRLERHR